MISWDGKIYHPCCFHDPTLEIKGLLLFLQPVLGSVRVSGTLIAQQVPKNRISGRKRQKVTKMMGGLQLASSKNDVWILAHICRYNHSCTVTYRYGTLRKVVKDKVAISRIDLESFYVLSDRHSNQVHLSVLQAEVIPLRVGRCKHRYLYLDR